MFLFHLLFGLAYLGGDQNQMLKLVALKEVLQVCEAILEGHIRHNIVDMELDLTLLFGISVTECFALDESDNFLKGESAGIEFTVQDDLGRKLVKLGENVLHMRKGLAKTREESIAWYSHTTSSIELRLDEAGKEGGLAALVIIMGEHGERHFCMNSLSSGFALCFALRVAFLLFFI